MIMREAVNLRSSRRKYLKIPLAADIQKRLETSCRAYNNESGLHIQLVTGDGEAFQGFRKSYGLLSGVMNYFVLAGNPKDPHWREKLGYYGEKLVLEATSYGLGTCWVGGSYDKGSCHCELADGEEIACVISVGDVAARKGTEKFLYRMVHRKTKAIEQMLQSDGEYPAWVSNGMELVCKAPSAMNKQPVRFYLRGNSLSAEVLSPDSFQGLDLGIAKLHFEIGAGQGRWDWGNGSQFHYFTPSDTI